MGGRLGAWRRIGHLDGHVDVAGVGDALMVGRGDEAARTAPAMLADGIL